MAAFELEHGDEPRFRCHTYFVILVICAAASLFAKPAAAASDIWMVVEGSGTATHWSATGRAAPLKSGDIVAAGDSVETGPDGRWVLQRRGHADSVTVSSRSRFMIPAPAAKGMLADIIQSMGTLFFNVEHTPGRRFEVDGPYLAAVVKGTSFTIAVSPSESTVNVLQGAVEVQSTGTHQVVLLGPGQFAKVSAFGRHELTGGARQSSAIPPSEGARVPAPQNTRQSGQQLLEAIGETHLDVGALTNNLVIGAGTQASSTANLSSLSSGAMPTVGRISSVGSNSVTQIGQPSPGGSPTANVLPSSTGAATVGGIASVGSNSVTQIGALTQGGLPNANVLPSSTGAMATVAGISSIAPSGLTPIGAPTPGGLPTANVLPSSTGGMATVSGISSIALSGLTPIGQPSPGGGGIPITVPGSTAAGVGLSGLAPAPLASSVAAPSNSPAPPLGLIGNIGSLLAPSHR
jgi:hypothetical protein